jgi:hypothetical protein
LEGQLPSKKMLCTLLYENSYKGRLSCPTPEFVA